MGLRDVTVFGMTFYVVLLVLFILGSDWWDLSPWFLWVVGEASSHLQATIQSLFELRLLHLFAPSRNEFTSNGP